jgi:NADH-quinone oxidoreductase subunit N
MNAFYIICGLGIFSLIAEIINMRKPLILLLMLGIAVALFFIVQDWNTAESYFSDMLLFDSFSLAFTGLLCVITFFWFWSAQSFFQDSEHITDRASLILFSLTGAILMTCFNSLVMLFLAIEILSIPLYVLAGSRRESLSSNEASFKYFLMGSFASGFLLMGIALVYGATGSFYLSAITETIASQGTNLPGFLYTGIFLMLIGIAFKISAVPFHFWAPDVYQGSPTPVTAFMSTIVKVAAFAAFLKLFGGVFVEVQTYWVVVMEVLAVVTLLVANITAVFQDNVKRMLAYSSVGHAGYVLVAFAGGGTDSFSVIYFYLSVYSVASLLAFTILSLVENANSSTLIENFKGLFYKNSFVAVCMILALLSLAGIPPLAGFFGKYQVFALALTNGYVGLVLLAVVTSLIGVYFYFRVIIIMFSKDAQAVDITPSVSIKILLIVLVILTLLLGIFPEALLSVIR